ncbi:S-norcoclaurine synthase [Quillaja saponaria]|uniref:S-norcoclaurine synthase n=1 Tax=Quillaja saponaria TaxID=32244 RepID=A0AAD7PCW0_QUISA|nr:S-norcoclaurine synthase [Quillaja saponaria]
MFGQVWHELELGVAASEVWDLCSTSRLGKLISTELCHVIEKVNIIEGDGGVGTVLKVKLGPGIQGPSNFIEKLTKIDNEKRIKEMEVIEGGYLELGFTLYVFRTEVIEKGNDSSIIKSSILYDIKEEAADNVTFVNLQLLIEMAELAKKHLNKN